GPHRGPLRCRALRPGEVLPRRPDTAVCCWFGEIAESDIGECAGIGPRKLMLANVRWSPLDIIARRPNVAVARGPPSSLADRSCGVRAGAGNRRVLILPTRR